MAGATAILSLVRGVFSAIGQIQQANAAADAANFNAEVAAVDAIIADQDRQTEIRVAAAEAADKKIENRRIFASIVTAYGGSGLSKEGSPLDVLGDTATELALDERRTRFAGYVANREGEIKVQRFKNDESLSRLEARNAKSAGGIAAFGAVLGGVGSALKRTA